MQRAIGRGFFLRLARRPLPFQAIRGRCGWLLRASRFRGARCSGPLQPAMSCLRVGTPHAQRGMALPAAIRVIAILVLSALVCFLAVRVLVSNGRSALVGALTTAMASDHPTVSKSWKAEARTSIRDGTGKTGAPATIGSGAAATRETHDSHAPAETHSPALSSTAPDIRPQIIDSARAADGTSLRVLTLNAEHLMSVPVFRRWKTFCEPLGWRDVTSMPRPPGLPYCDALDGRNLRGALRAGPLRTEADLAAKVQHLARLVATAAPDLVLMQEVTDVAAVRAVLGDGWEIHTTHMAKTGNQEDMKDTGGSGKREDRGNPKDTGNPEDTEDTESPGDREDTGNPGDTEGAGKGRKIGKTCATGRTGGTAATEKTGQQDQLATRGRTVTAAVSYRTSQHLAIAWRIGRFVPRPRTARVDTLIQTVNGHPATRPGLAVYLSPQPGLSLAILNVHLKAGCRQGRMDRGLSNQPQRRWQRSAACRVLQAQVPALETWLDAQIAAGRQVIISGDFNRDLRAEQRQAMPARADGRDAATPATTHEASAKISSLLAELDDDAPPGARLFLVRNGPYRKLATCHRHIDPFLLSEGLLTRLEQAAEQLRVTVIPFTVPVSLDAPRPSDHCPHLLTLRFRTPLRD